MDIGCVYIPSTFSRVIMQRPGFRQLLRILPFRRWISHFCCYLLLFGATVFASEASERERNLGTASWISGSCASSPSKYNKETNHPIFTTHDAASVSKYSHSRVLNQHRESETEEGLQCALDNDVTGRFYDESSQIWTVNNALLNEVNNDIQRVLDCAVQNDVLRFRTRDTIQPRSSMTIQLPLTMRSESGITFTCPQQGALIISRSTSFTMENVVISGCNGTSSIVVLSPNCTSRRVRGTTRLRNVSFEDNGVFVQGHLVKANSACLQLHLTSVTFLRNRCIGSRCVLLGPRTTLRNIRIENNQGSNTTTLDSSIFSASDGSQTIATNMTSSGNEIRSFHISNGILNITNSLFIRNGRNQSYARGDNSMGGGVLFSIYSSVSVSNSAFESNYATNGGAIYALVSNVSIEDCVFRENNVGEGNGGALYGRNHSSFDISSSVFSENRGYRGAVLHSEESRWVNVATSRILENSCSRSGGISISSGSAIIRSCEFLRNVARVAASALLVETVELSLQNSSFVSNRAETGSACFFQLGSAVYATGLLFYGNEARVAQGGGICLVNWCRLTLEDSTFERNNAAVLGGALFVERGNSVSIRRVEFANNTSIQDGGGIYVEGGYDPNANIVIMASNVSIESCRFINNKAASGGSIAFLRVSNSTISNCTFLNNVARKSGGAVLMLRSNTSLNVVEFSNNRAANGGAMFLQDRGNLTISNCNSTDNGARRGGFAYLQDSSNMTISRSLFVNNTAQSRGGVIDVIEGSRILLFYCSLSRNKAELGGGLWLQDNGTALVSNCNFNNNVASSSGGVMSMQQANTTMYNVTMFQNEAHESCGGIFATEASHLEATNVTIRDNIARDAGGGVVVANASSLLCHSCTFLHNRAVHGAGLYALSNNSIPIVAQLQDSHFEHNSAESRGGGIEFAAPHSRSINCSIPSLTCGHLLLLNTSFVENYANHTGAAILTTDASRVLLDCEYQGSRNHGFINESDFISLEVLHPRRLCPSWKRNNVSSFSNGAVVGTYGQDVVLSVDADDEVRLVGSTRSGYVLENVSSGRQLPMINVTILDRFGVGPAPTLPLVFEARISSSDGFFNGLYPTTIATGFGSFSRVVGFVHPGIYTLEFVFDNSVFEAFNVTISVRECRIGEESTRGGLTCQVCDAFSYNFNPSEVGGCKECPNDATCERRFIVPDEGYWHNGPCHDVVQECLAEEACKYENRREALTSYTQNFTDCNLNKTTLEAYQDDLCHEGYEGPLCGSCKTSYGLSFLFECLKCPRKILSFLIIAGVTLYLFAASSFTIRGCLPFDIKRARSISIRLPSNESRSASVQDPEVNVEMVRMMVEGRVPPEYFQRNQGASTSQTPKESVPQESEYDLTKWKVTEIFKIMINFLQTTAVAASVDVDWTSGTLGVFQTSEYVGAVATSAISRPVVCITSSSSRLMRSVWRMLFSIFVPCFVMLMFAAFWAFMALRDGEDATYFTKRIVLSVIAVTYISYLGLTRMAVRAFYCVDVYDFVDPFVDSKTSFWAIDTSIKCYEGDHFILIAIGVIVLALVSIAFPLISAFVLCKKRQANRNKDSWIFETAGFLFRAFKDTCLFWESLVMLRKACLSVIVVFSYPLGGLSQGILALVVLLAGLYAHVTVRPYRKEFKILNHFESASLLVSCLTFTLGLFFGFDKCSSSVRFFLAFIIIVANTLFFLFLLFAFCRNAMVHIRVVLQYENVRVPDAAPWWRVLKIYITSRSYRCGQS